MKTQTPIKQTAHRLAAVLAIALAFVTTGAWAEDWTVSENTALTEDKTVDALTVDSGVTLDLNGYKLYCTSLAGSGTITSTSTDLTSPDTDGTHVTWSWLKDSDGTSVGTPANGSAAALFNDDYSSWKVDNRLRLGGTVNLQPFTVCYDFGEDTPAVVNQYKITNGGSGSSYLNRSPYIWDFDASNDGDKWVNLHNVEKNTYEDIWSEIKQTKTYAFENTTAYRYYRIVFRMTGTSDLELKQLEYFGPGELHVNVPAGSEATVGSLTISGNMKVVKDGDGRLNGVTGVGISTFPGAFEVNAGTVYVETDFLLGETADGTVTVNGGTVEVSTTKTTHVGQSSGKTGTVNLNGGVLKTKRLVNVNSGIGKVNFNGGTLQANSTNINGLFGDNVTVTVNERGGKIDSGNNEVKVPAPISGTGAIWFKGGNTITHNAASTYTGGTTVEAGTVVVVPDVAKRTALGAITVAGLENNICEVVRLSGEETFSAGDLPANTETVTFFVSPDGKSILAANGLEGPYWIGGSGDLGAAPNWFGGVVPTENPTIKWSSPITLTNSGGFAPDTFTIPDDSAVVTLSGALTVNCLTNASRLAVASTGSLTVTGDLVATVESNGGSRTFLHSNEGTVTVGGKAIGYTNAGGFPDVYEYAAVTENTRPIQAHGIAYQCGGSVQLEMKLQSSGNTAGSWVVGADGFSFPGSRNANYTTFFAESAAVTLYSADDWTLANSKKYNTTRGDLFVSDSSGSSLVIDTSDYVTPATRRTVTLEGRIVAYNPVTIKGCGTVVVDTTGSSTHASVPEDFRHTCLTNAATLYVTDTATLKVNAGKKITGNGTISLADGTTLALASTGREFATPDIVPVTLPETGKATIKIDGERLRSSVNFTVCSLADLPEGYNVADHVTVTGTALGGRKYEVKAVEVAENETTFTNLVLNIEPTGAMVIVF